MFVSDKKMQVIHVKTTQDWKRLLRDHLTIPQIRMHFGVSMRTAYRYAELMQRYLVIDDVRYQTFIVVPRRSVNSFKRPRRGNPRWN